MPMIMWSDDFSHRNVELVGQVDLILEYLSLLVFVVGRLDVVRREIEAAFA